MRIEFLTILLGIIAGLANLVLFATFCGSACGLSSTADNASTSLFSVFFIVVGTVLLFYILALVRYRKDPAGKRYVSPLLYWPVIGFLASIFSKAMTFHYTLAWVAFGLVIGGFASWRAKGKAATRPYGVKRR